MYEYFCLAPGDVEREIIVRMKVIIFVGYGGRVGRLDDIIKLCQKYNLKLILVALTQLKYLKEDNAGRRKIAAKCNASFKENEKLQVVGATYVVDG